MKKTTMMLAIITFIAIIFYTLPAAPNCCSPESDCCCPDYTKFGLDLEEYVCVCTPTGGPIIWGECTYSHPVFDPRDW
jgi:hypothetical protein